MENKSKDSTKINGSDVSVVMVTLNEEDAIRKVVADIKFQIDNAEIIVVDSSSDNTADIARELGCIVIRQFPPKDYGPAMDVGFHAATREIIITTDCDDTYPAKYIPELLKLIASGYDFVSASRLGNRPKAMPFPNYIANRCFCFLAWLICGVRSSDVHTGMRAYKRNVLLNFPYNPSWPTALVLEIQVGLLALGYKGTEINIDYQSRIGVTKTRRLFATYWTMKRLWRWRRFFNPLRNKLLDEKNRRV
jgi:glycosyltransferase involved in cell wall biosynthesis